MRLVGGGVGQSSSLFHQNRYCESVMQALSQFGANNLYCLALEKDNCVFVVLNFPSLRFLKAFLASACGWRSQEGGRNSAIAVGEDGQYFGQEW
ncbi:hypothetical protein H6G93_38905 [Nostoc sp. FACHB-973]|nr:hypothetical protein [Nostoc sp. FACHB-973]